MTGNQPERFQRGSGILLHITSLPGGEGNGTLGRDARDFTDILKQGGQKYWQILPLGPVSRGYGYSPYSSYSAFAGNPLIIDPRDLMEEPWSAGFPPEVLPVPSGSGGSDFAYTEETVPLWIESSFRDFSLRASNRDREDYITFCSENRDWLEDFSLYESASHHFGTYNWRSWPPEMRKRNPEEIQRFRMKFNLEIDKSKFAQFIFQRQWNRLRESVSRNGISLIGDIPIYTAMDSADTWSHPGIFDLTANLEPEGVSGVPPDYFSETGQKWGNPLYNWFRDGELSEETLLWWKSRIFRQLKMVDILRIDHFRAFESYWAVDPSSPDGRTGAWRKGPGRTFFDSIRGGELRLPIIAEDLGIITPEVEELLKETGFPGMKVLQFAFHGGKDNPHLPENISDPNCVMYTGTHDNNTTSGWYRTELDPEARSRVRDRADIHQEENLIWPIIHYALASPADICILPFQDILGLGPDARMNTPGSTDPANWKWRASPAMLENAPWEKLREMSLRHGRSG